MELPALAAGVLIGLVAAAALFAAVRIQFPSLPAPSAPPPLAAQLPSLALEGFSPVEVEIHRPFIVLVRQDNISCNSTLSAVTDDLQLSSIERALTGSVEARPNPHELMADSLRRFGIETVMVRIDRLDGTAYLASLILRRGQELLSLDSRPSDAIAIALRANASTYIKDELFEKNAKAECR